MAQPTDAVYQHDASLRELLTDITSCRRVSSLSESERALFKNAPSIEHVVATKETIFYPKGGGQPSDTGTMKPANAKSPDRRNGSISNPDNNHPGEVDPVFEVHLVRKTPDSQILHGGRFSSSATIVDDDGGDDGQLRHQSGLAHPYFVDGNPVLQTIDRAKRDYHSRLHTAGHIIDIAVAELRDVVGSLEPYKANHAPGEACVEYRGLIAGEHKASIQEKANEVVRRNLPVNILWWNEQQLKEGLVAAPDTIPPPENGLYRVVDIGGLGCCPCGGTHLPSTADVGPITIRKISRQKGVSRVSYEVPPTF